MTKREFIESLKERLSGLPRRAVEERISFFSEMIDDRIEDGMTEEEAVENLGSVDGIAMQILSEIPLTKLVKEKFRTKRKTKKWEIVCLFLGFPLWFPLIITAICLGVAFYAVVWSLVISLWAIEVSFIGAGVGGILASAVFAVSGHTASSGFILACSLVCLGLSIFIFFVCKNADKFMIKFTKLAVLPIKKLFIKK